MFTTSVVHRPVITATVARARSSIWLLHVSTKLSQKMKCHNFSFCFSSQTFAINFTNKSLKKKQQQQQEKTLHLYFNKR